MQPDQLPGQLHRGSHCLLPSAQETVPRAPIHRALAGLAYPELTFIPARFLDKTRESAYTLYGKQKQE